ncbi:MAG: HNH endonuclease [Tannerellaceae bacterium]|jgi:uncharacterized protein (TIGR02646 family)|nr:HNH endonuclease [Tannerellaceae bacterium]
MIRVKKSISGSSALQTSYNHQDVCKQLLKDQHDKCYICEQRIVTNYHVDHLQSQHHHPDLKQEWVNLFMACSYCNERKSDKYDNILHPSNHNIEEIIIHQNDFQAKKVLFSSADDRLEVSKTIELLLQLFNGREDIGRNFKEKRFYEEFLRKINLFLKKVNEYISGNPAYGEAIDEELREESELLGFKYHIIKNNRILTKDFGHLIVWNKMNSNE